MTRYMRRSTARDESGAALIFALIIVTTIALVSGVILSHGGTNFSATLALRGVASTSYAGDAAAKVALNNLRMGSSAPGFVQAASAADDAPWVYSNALDGTGCFGLEGSAPRNNLQLNGIQPATGDQSAASSARVECAVVPGTGLFAGGGGVETNGNKRAITIFGSGLTVQNNSMLQVRGGIASNGFIDADNASGTGIFTNGYVWANAGCTGTITSTPAKDCSHPDVSDPTYSDVFTSTAGVVARDATAQACGSFQPGYYSSASELSSRTTACGTAVFVPGDYYFDFDDQSSGAGQNVWNITDTVIGGQVTGSGDPPGRCRSPIDDTSAVGVHFVFGGDSRIVVGKDAKVEICGTYAADTVPIVVQQQQSSTTSVNGNRSVIGATVATAGSTPAWSVAPTPSSIGAVGGADAQWPGSASGTPKGVLTVTDLTPSPAIPTGAQLLSATVKVRHKEVGAIPVQVKVTAGASTFTGPLTTRTVATLAAPYPAATPDSVTVTGAALTALARAVRYGTLSSSMPTLELSLTGKNLAMAIDSVSLELTYSTWALRTAVDNDLLTGFGNSFKGDFLLQGALYAPHGAVDVNFGNNSGTVVAFRYGLAVREALLAGHPQVTYGYPLVSIPDAGTGLGKRVTVVDLKVFVCVEQASCAAGGTHTLTARALITDPPWTLGNEPVPGKRRIEVLSWAEQK